MGRFIESEERGQLSLMPTSLDEYVEEDNPVRAVDAFMDELDLGALGFAGVVPAAAGRPGYHPSTLLKLYLCGYLNRVQSSRRLEREAKRNVEVMWLTGRLVPDFKTIADFRKNNGPAIQAACAKFVEICVDLGMFKHAVAAIDGAKFKAVNSRDRNFTRGKLKRRMEQITESIGRYLEALDVADLQDGAGAEENIDRLTKKVATMRARLAELQEIEKRVHEAPDQQISLTDPDSRAMATNMRGASTVGNNVQAAVDTDHHLIVAHEVTNVVVDRTLLAPMPAKAKAVMRTDTLEAPADRGYYSGEQLLACEQIGVKSYVPRPRTSNARAECRFDKEDFDYLPETDAYRCPAGKTLPFRFMSVHDGQNVRIYFTNECCGCLLHLLATGTSIQTRNRTMTGFRFLFRITMRRLDLASEIHHIMEPTRIPQILSTEEAARLITVAGNLQARVLLAIGYGAGSRVSEAVKLKVRHIDASLHIIRVEQGKGRKDRHVMLSPKLYALMRQWCLVRSTHSDEGVPVGERWLFAGRGDNTHLTARQVTRLFQETIAAAGIKKKVTLRRRPLAAQQVEIRQIALGEGDELTSERRGRSAMALAMRRNRAVRSRPGREYSVTPSARLWAWRRHPSHLISRTQSGPEGGPRRKTGAQGQMKRGGDLRITGSSPDCKVVLSRLASRSLLLRPWAWESRSGSLHEYRQILLSI